MAWLYWLNGMIDFGMDIQENNLWEQWGLLARYNNNILSQNIKTISKFTSLLLYPFNHTYIYIYMLLL